ncbi:hypothetical protein BDR22DRAFT_854104 [Usnea florida]
MSIWLDFISSQNIEMLSSKRFKRNTTEAIFMLCSLGANVSARMPYGGAQPLHRVAGVPYSLKGSFHATSQFEILLDFGADPCARDGWGRTVTQIACSSGWEEQWFQALRKCNKAQVVIEQLRAELAGWKDAPLDDAIRTGVDVTDLSKPSFGGLSRRIVARGDRLDD